MKRTYPVLIMLLFSAALVFTPAILLNSCQQINVDQEKQQYIKKVVKDKKQATTSRTKYAYNMWHDRFELVPQIEDKFYIIFTDGSYRSTDVGTWTITNIGDTLTELY